MRKDKLQKKKKFTLTAPFSYVFDELLWLDGMKSISVYYANNHTSDPFVPAAKQSRYIAKEFVYFYRFLTQMFFFNLDPSVTSQMNMLQVENDHVHADKISFLIIYLYKWQIDRFL